MPKKENNLTNASLKRAVEKMNLPSLKGLPAEVVKNKMNEALLAEGINVEKLKDKAVIRDITEQGISVTSLTKDFDKLAENISNGGPEAAVKGAKKPLKIIVLPSELPKDSQRGGKAAAISIIRSKIQNAASAAGWSPEDLMKPMGAIDCNFKSGQGQVKTGGKPYIEAMSEVIYQSAVMRNNFNKTKEGAEESLGTAAPDYGRTANAIGDMVGPSGDGTLEMENGEFVLAPN